MNRRPHEPPLPDPLAYFITWGTYGTWLPGDERGWVEYHRGWQFPDPVRRLEASAIMTEDACRLDPQQREAVHQQIAETCRHRGWQLHAVNCRTNHLHVVVTAPVDPKVVRSQLKAWCTRKLKSLAGALDPAATVRENWWAERGSQRYLNDEVSLEAAIIYVRDGQDGPRFEGAR
jgi:REP element-mobilizing transposase RayT